MKWLYLRGDGGMGTRVVEFDFGKSVVVWFLLESYVFGMGD